MSQERCSRCGAALTPEARFCAQCGAPVETATTEERKVVTVLFADLAGSTELAGHLDPERFRELMAAFYRDATKEIDAMGGRAEKFVGDAVMAVFGIPHAHDDDTVRAIHAAIRIRDRVGRLGDAYGVALRIRAGINTGPVATGGGPAGQFLVSGTPVNAAARLQQAAEPGEILAGPTTRTVAAPSVSFGEERMVLAKGFDEPLAAWRVVAVLARSTRRGIAIVGRRRELALLRDAFDRVVETSRAHVVTLTGEAGIGKSRLLAEFIDGLSVRVLAGRASEFDDDPVFSAVAEMIRRELHVDRETPRKEVQERLHDLVAGCCNPAEVERIAARVGLAVGIGERNTPYEIAEVRAGLLALLEGLSADGPIVLVFEDLEAARQGLLDLVEQVAARARGMPVLVVCVGRSLPPSWGAGLPDALSIRLETLPPHEAAELARAAGSGTAEAERIAQHAGGNPFFIVETSGMMAASGTTQLPPTVQAVVASRIDHLPRAARDLVRKASVFPGSTFRVEELALITPADPATLELLEDEELLAREGDGWRFRHDLLRDVAYDSLAKRERMRLHLAVAEGGSTVAYHLEQAARASLDLNPADRSIADRAVEALASAGDVARRRIQSRTALSLYERALTLTGPSESWGAREARILAGIGESRYWRGEYDDALASLERALDLGGSDVWTRAHAWRYIGDIALNVQADLPRADRAFEQAIIAARELGDSWAIARTLLVAAWLPYMKDEIEIARSMFSEAIDVARSNHESRDRWGEARALTFLAIATTPVGNAEECLRLVTSALEIGREIDDQFTIAVAQQTRSSTLRRLARYDEASAEIDAAVEAFADLGAPWEQASALGDRGFTRRLLGDLDGAEADLREALAICRTLGERTLGAWTASELARVMLRRGRLDEAQSILRHPSTQIGVEERGSRASLANTAGLAARAAGDRETALARFKEALELERQSRRPNSIALQVFATAALFGDDAAGGAGAVAEARALLEAAGWTLALTRPEEALT